MYSSTICGGIEQDDALHNTPSSFLHSSSKCLHAADGSYSLYVKTGKKEKLDPVYVLSFFFVVVVG